MPWTSSPATNDNSVSVLLGNERGVFRPALGSPFAVGGSPYPPAVGDVNGDGKPDIVTPNVRGNSVSVLLGDGKGGFARGPASPLSVLARPYFAALADVSGDRNLDILLSHDDTNQMTILLGDGRGGFRPAPGSPFNAGARGWKIQVGDINSDGKVDLVTGAVGNRVLVLLGNGHGGFAPATYSPIPTGHGPWSVLLADFNSDGNLDIATANQGTSDVTVLLAQR